VSEELERLRLTVAWCVSNAESAMARGDHTSVRRHLDEAHRYRRWAKRLQRAAEAGDHAAVQKIIWALGIYRQERFRQAVDEEKARWEADWQRQQAAKAAWLRGLIATAVRPTIRPRERRDASGRSSAKSGDSGSDDPAGDEPPVSERRPA
jgi:hypothetical protein